MQPQANLIDYLHLTHPILCFFLWQIYAVSITIRIVVSTMKIERNISMLLFICMDWRITFPSFDIAVWFYVDCSDLEV